MGEGCGDDCCWLGRGTGFDSEVVPYSVITPGRAPVPAPLAIAAAAALFVDAAAEATIVWLVAHSCSCRRRAGPCFASRANRSVLGGSNAASSCGLLPVDTCDPLPSAANNVTAATADTATAAAAVSVLLPPQPVSMISIGLALVEGLRREGRAAEDSDAAPAPLVKASPNGRDGRRPGRVGLGELAAGLADPPTASSTGEKRPNCVVSLEAAAEPRRPCAPGPCS